MRPWLLTGLLFILLTLPQVASQTEAPSLGLTGTVCSWDEPQATGCAGTGLSEATIRIHGDGMLPLDLDAVDKETTTDSQGRFSFDVLPGTYTLQVERHGFLPTTIEADAPGDVEVNLTGDLQIMEGDVVSPEGWPIPEAAVTIVHAGQNHTGTTDVRGRYAITAPSGNHTVRIDQPLYFPVEQHFFFDDVLHPTFRMEPDPEKQLWMYAIPLHGTVQDQDGNPVPDAEVRVQNSEYDRWRHNPDSSGYALGGDPFRGDGLQIVTTGPDGRFQAKVHPEYATLTVRKEGYQTTESFLPIADQVSITKDMELYRFPERTARISGRIVDAETGTPVTNVQIRVEWDERPRTECSRFVPEIVPGEPYSYGNNGCRIIIHPDGTFEGNVTPGPSTVRIYQTQWETCERVRLEDGTYQKRCGREHYTQAFEIDLPSGEETWIDVALERKPFPDTRISGYVLDNETRQPIPWSYLLFIHRDGDCYGNAYTDADGSYRVQLRSGTLDMAIMAQGYHTWTGTIDLAADEEAPFDVRLDTVRAPDDPMQAFLLPPGFPGYPVENVAFFDNAGGLGPYDPVAREAAMDAYWNHTHAAPALGLPFGILVLCALASLHTVRIGWF